MHHFRSWRDAMKKGAGGDMRAERAGLLTGVAVVAMAAALAGEARAAADDRAVTLQEVIVTAVKRETNLQETPVAITALSGANLAARDIKDIQSLSVSVPGLVFAESVSQQQVMLRGIGTDIPNLSGETGVAFHIDGVYLGSLDQATAAFGDLDRIEVLRGPQGTLYGRNATGGAINLITKAPQFKPEADLTALYGNYEHVELRASMTGPLSDQVAGRLSLYTDDRDGYRHNLTNGQRLDDNHERSLRGALLFTPSDKLEIVLRGDYDKDRFTGNPNKPLGVGSPSAGEDTIQNIPGIGRFVRDPLIDFADFPDHFEKEIWGASATATYKTPDVIFKSITAYRHDNMPLSIDSDGTELLGLNIANTVTDRQLSQEFQLSSAQMGSVEWLAGAFFYDQHSALGINALFATPFGPFPFISQTVQDTKSAAAFGEVYLNLDDKLRITLGARYTDDRKNFSNSFGVSGRASYSAFTPKLGIEKKFTPDVFGYATVSQGFKAGGFNVFDATGFSFRPEKVTAYEAGLKTQGWDHRARINTSVFYYDYRDLQVTQFPGDGTQLIRNAANARIYGADVDFQLAPTDGLRFDGILSLLNARFRKFITADVLDPAGPLRDLTGKHLIRSPPVSGTFGAEVDVPAVVDGKITLRGELSYSDTYFFTAFNRPPAEQKAYTMVNAFITYRAADGTWQANVFGRNLSNVAILTSGFDSPKVGSFGAPRTFGVSVSRRFN
jgi:iron complex outermembrane receptor protein